MHVKLLVALCCLLLMCSCSPVTIQNTESLLVAPKLNKRQAEVSQALEASLSLRVTYRYPQGGEYRSPFVFYDMDGDGLEEAVVFYSYTNEADSRVRAKILTQDSGGEWSPFYDVRSQSAQVEFVQFEKLLGESAGHECMIVGWRGTGRQPSTLEIYSMAGRDFKPEATITYYNHSIEDFDGDGLSEIVVIGQEGSRGRYGVSLVSGRGGHIETVSTIPLSSEAESALTLTAGKLWDGSTAVYIDETLIGGPVTTIATEIIRVSADGLTVLCGDAEMRVDGAENTARNNYELTFRDDDVYCRDFDGDGVVEVPYPAEISDVYESGDVDTPKITQFMHLTQTGFEVRRTGVINSDSGYLVFFPDRWRDRIVVERERESLEWRFRKWNSDTHEPAEELLRIRVSPTKDYLDMFEVEDYVELYTRGTTSYTAYIPKLQGEAMAVTDEEVKGMFRVLPS